MDVRKKRIRDDKSNNRYMSIDDRKDESRLPVEMIRNIQLGKEDNTFKTASLSKDPFDEVIFRRLIFDLRPSTIFEFGIFL